jgi:uncharacterized phage-associated protein
MPFDAAAVANHFLDKEALDHMKLQKLAYIAHGWHLAIVDSPLFYNRVEAWKYGPVIPDLYHSLKLWGRKPITERLVHTDPSSCALVPWDFDKSKEAEQARLIADRVWEVYKGFSPLELSAMTHEKGTPWEQVRSNCPSEALEHGHLVIPPNLIRDHYRKIATRSRENGR